MTDENLHRRPLPPCDLDRNELLSLVNRLAWEQATYGGYSQDAKPEASTIIQSLQTGFISGTSSSISPLGILSVVQETRESIHMRFKSSLPLSYSLDLDGESGRIVVDISDCVDH